MKLDFSVIWTAFLTAGAAIGAWVTIGTAFSRAREEKAKGRTDYVTEQHRRMAQLEDDVDQLRRELAQISAKLIHAEREAGRWQAMYETEHAMHMAALGRLDESNRPK